MESLLKGSLDLNMQRFHFSLSDFKLWGSARRKVALSSSPQAAVGVNGKPISPTPLRCSNTETAMC